MYSDAVFIATSSEPNDLVSHVFCFFDIKYIGVLLIKMMNPVLNFLVTVSPVCSAPTKQRIITSFPSDVGMFGVKDSFSSPKKYFHSSVCLKSLSSITGYVG